MRCGMIGYMKIFWEWLSAIFSSWQAWASGGGFGGAVLLIITLLEWKDIYQVKARTKFFLVVWCFTMGASFVGWTNERRAVGEKTNENAQLVSQIADLNKPDLKPKITTVTGGTDNRGNTIVILQVEVWDAGAPTSLTIGTITVKSKDGQYVPVKQMFAPAEDVHLGQSGLLLADEYFPRRASLGPIPRGGKIEGWLRFETDLPLAQIRSGAVVSWSVRDITGKESYASMTLNGALSTDMYFPRDFKATHE